MTEEEKIIDEFDKFWDLGVTKYNSKTLRLSEKEIIEWLKKSLKDFKAQVESDLLKRINSGMVQNGLIPTKWYDYLETFKPKDNFYGPSMADFEAERIDSENKMMNKILKTFKPNV